MTLGKRKKFCACFLAVECVFTVCASGYTVSTFFFIIILFLDQAALLSFLYPSPRPPTFHRRNKQNEQANNAWSQARLALSSLQCPVQLAPSTRDRIEDSTWSTQCKPKKGSFSIAMQSLNLHWILWKGPSTAKKNFSRKLPIPFHADLSLLLKACQRVCWDPGQNCWDFSVYFFNFAPCNNLLYTEQSHPLPTPCSKLLRFSKQYWNRGGGNGKHFCQEECRR